MTLKDFISGVDFDRDLLPLYKKEYQNFDDIYSGRQLLDELQQLEPDSSSEEIVVKIWNISRHHYFIAQGLEGSFIEILGKSLIIDGECDTKNLVKVLLFFIKDNSSSSDGFYPIRFMPNKSHYSTEADRIYHNLVEKYTYNCEEMSFDESYDVFLQRQSHANRIKKMRDRRIQLKINHLMQQHRAANSVDLLCSLDSNANPQELSFLIESDSTLEYLFRPYPSDYCATLEALLAYTKIPEHRDGRSLAAVYYGNHPNPNRGESVRSLLESYGPFRNFHYTIGSSDSLPSGREYLFVVIGD